jgi:hypothetical protein
MGQQIAGHGYSSGFAGSAFASAPLCSSLPRHVFQVVCRIFSKKKDHGMWMLTQHSHSPEGSHGQVKVYRVAGRGTGKVKIFSKTRFFLLFFFTVTLFKQKVTASFLSNF